MYSERAYSAAAFDVQDGCFMYKEHLDGLKHQQPPFCGAELSAASRERVERSHL